MYQRKNGNFLIDFFCKKTEFIFTKGVGSGVENPLLFESKRSGKVDFTPFFPKELEWDFTPKKKE